MKRCLWSRKRSSRAPAACRLTVRPTLEPEDMAEASSPSFDDLRRRYRDSLSSKFGREDADRKDEWPAERTDDNARCALEQAFRDALLELVSKDRKDLERLIDFCVECCRRKLVSATMPVVLLGDLFDAITLDGCERLFDYVEAGVDVWKEELFFVACKNNLLRMCNDLLRRLSRSQNTIFCGRILLFLAKFFPFSERSGLNIVSEFNLENVTELGGDDDFKDPHEDDAAPPDDGGKKSGINIDYNLYCKFWGLQEFFRNPNLCYNKVQWKTFVSYSSCVLSAFSSYKLECIQLKDKSGRKRSSSAMETDSKDDQHYFAKFLTNRKLLELQLSDSSFRRCILVQFLILFQYLQSSVKFKMESFELKTDQSDWVKETADLIYKLIAETPPDGSNFANNVKHILKREELWNNWKNNGCLEFKDLKNNIVVDTNTNEETRKILKPRRKRLLGDIIKDYDNQGKYYMGNNELTKLWNLCPDNLESCMGKDRDFLPSLHTYLAEAIDQSERKVKGDERVVANGNFGWRALRLLACRSPYFFTYSSNIISRLPDYLDNMIERIAKDLRANSDSKPTEQEIVEEATEEQMEAELIKEGDSNDVDQSQDSELQSGDTKDYDSAEKSQPKVMTEQQMAELCEKLQDDWKKLALKLGFKQDEILYFKQEHPTNATRASKMLEIYFQDDEDASVEHVAYVLEGLGLMEAAAVLKDPED